MTKYKWTVEFEWNDEDDFENEETHVTTIEEDGITHWRYRNPTTLLPWKLIKKEKINE